MSFPGSGMGRTVVEVPLSLHECAAEAQEVFTGEGEGNWIVNDC